MIELLEKLQKLQLIDSYLEKIERSKEGLPSIVKELEITLMDKKDEVKAKLDEITEVSNSIKANAETISESNEYLIKYKQQRNNVTNNREYEAINNEITYRENLITECEENKVSLNNKLESCELELSKLRTEEENLSEKLWNNRALLDKKIEETSAKENELRDMRVKVVATIPINHLKMYDKISSSKDGIAVVYGDKGHCGGCRSILPSQKVSELKRKTSLVQCDVCSRILTWGFMEKDLLRNEDH
ncbi:MAG: hypothetical protein JXR48_08930 [Candidatus Delongbacteria bacterium]|nr:hypothetical protein [Candidatus Delongbacteria bacterium]MBN2835075.1 hypothetical protein [Candidatus Delongbacteria bacterium]